MEKNDSIEVMKIPRTVDISITGRCNLRCKHCSHFTSAGDTGEELPTAEWLRFIEELGHLSVMDITLEGGEPFFREDIKEIIQHIVLNRMRFSVLSNGTLIDEELAAYLSSTGRCSGVQVSIDGSSPAVHDALRGEGTFVRALGGVHNLKRCGVSVTVRVTVNKYNLKDLDNIARLLLEKIGLSSFSTNSASYMGLCRQFSEEIQLSVDERSEAMKELARLNRKYGGRIGAMAGPLANAKNWMEMEKARQVGLESLPDCGYLTSCGGVFSKLAVRSDGVLVACLQMSHIELGKINRDQVRQVWQHHSELKRLRKRVQVSLTDFEFCKGCDYVRYCRGNCPALAYTILGNDFHPSPESCLRLFLKQGGRFPEKELSAV